MSEIIAQRVIEESVPGKQITLAHVIAAPIGSVYQSCSKGSGCRDWFLRPFYRLGRNYR